MKSIELLETLVGKDLRQDEILYGVDLTSHIQFQNNCAKILKGHLENALYYESSNKKALCFEPDVIIDDFGVEYYYWKIEA